jgi:mRNA interferase HigB
MRVIARNRITEYYAVHPDAQTALEEWYQKVRKAEWTSFADMKRSFNSVDSVGNQRYVFNIKGNNHRLIVVVKFTIKTVLIRFIGTHAEYDRINVKNI